MLLDCLLLQHALQLLLLPLSFCIPLLLSATASATDPMLVMPHVQDPDPLGLCVCVRHNLVLF